MKKVITIVLLLTATLGFGQLSTYKDLYLHVGQITGFGSQQWCDSLAHLDSDRTAGGGGSPAGPNRSIQYNHNSSFAGVDSNLWEKSAIMGASGNYLNLNFAPGNPTFSGLELGTPGNHQEIIFDRFHNEIQMRDSMSGIVQCSGGLITLSNLLHEVDIADPGTSTTWQLKIPNYNGVIPWYIPNNQNGIFSNDGAGHISNPFYYHIENNVMTGYTGNRLNLSVNDFTGDMGGFSIQDSTGNIGIGASSDQTALSLNSLTETDLNSPLTLVHYALINPIKNLSISLGAGAGSGSPSVSDTGGILAGTIVLQTGTSPSGNSKILTLSFTSPLPFPNGCSVILYPGNINAATPGLNSNTIYVTSSTTQFIIWQSAITGLTGGDTYIWKYQIIGY